MALRQTLFAVNPLKKKKVPATVIKVHDPSDAESEPDDITDTATKSGQDIENKDGQQVFSGVTQVSKRTGQKVRVDTAQDSDDANSKVTGLKKEDKDVDKDGYQRIKLYFYPQGKGPKQVS
ncbi:hypothetical protein PtA15_8A80 [Puccinia triticina]|uniref:Hypervirulence associated protein TUDOR domain-containing protein n=1 Tax=Puccinia triticina TaxID=208348 RepID=A0ABY7CPK2_9BASI|nr:uncharacterized protein PtA15_8A80 [Puccinia triticina]WAQ87179.1 hypothetical protein PtA15_8A80 [Puccinia triticina]